MRLAVENLSVALGGKMILNKMSLRLDRPGLVGLIGPNGAGKTTLLRAVSALLPFSGAIELDGASIVAKSAKQRARLIAYLAQGAQAHWPLSVKRLVALGRLPHLEPFRSLSQRDEAAIERAMRLADIESFAERNVLTLSGGERARVFLARALAVEAPLLLVDEPVASLDPYHQLGIMEVLKAYAIEGRTVIAVLHDLSLASRFCDRQLLLDKGRLHADGRPETVLTDDNMRSVYRVTAQTAGEGAARYVVPLARTDA
jgi:iron complex transport system ATP-binding protein